MKAILHRAEEEGVIAAPEAREKADEIKDAAKEEAKKVEEASKEAAKD